MDCNKTIDFFVEAKRLCDSRATCDDTAHDEQCPFFKCCKNMLITLGNEEIEKTVEILQKWSNEHPKKTYEQDFLEKFPDAPKYELVNSRYPRACRISIYDGECPGTGCAECWNEPMEE